MDYFRIAPEWTFIGVSWILFVLKVLVAFDGFFADVTHHGTTGTHHLVAAVLLDKPLLTLPTLSDHGFSHFVLQEDTCVSLMLLFYLFTPQWNMVWLLTKPARVFHTFWVETLENFILWVRHYSLEIAERAGHQVLNACCCNLF